ncbi:hypothetical protein PG5_35140 [Pseudomonas sp. G5(2012)]|nr:hypothetical protein PG5_35140 [Pseudomonas sp. G5(2012)]
MFVALSLMTVVLILIKEYARLCGCCVFNYYLIEGVVMGIEKEEQGKAAISGAKDHNPGVGGIRTTIKKGDIERRINFGDIDFLSWTPGNFLLKASNSGAGGEANLEFGSNLDLLVDTEYAISSDPDAVEAYCEIKEFMGFGYYTSGNITFTTLIEAGGELKVAGKFDFKIVNSADPTEIVYVHCPEFAVSAKVRK